MATDVPFSHAEQLHSKPLKVDNTKSGLTYPDGSCRKCLPGHRFLRINSPEANLFLRKDLLTPRLDRMQKCLWLVAKQDSSHISSLTEQIVRGRRIVLTDDPELHLVWYHDRVFVKPLPKYLLSHEFWNVAFGNDATRPGESSKHALTINAAKGFLRSYAYLVQRKPDLTLALDTKLGLLPKATKYSEFRRFASACQINIADRDVSPRYRYGELRLSRLNLWAKILLREPAFKKVHHQHSDRIAQLYGPLLFIFAAGSVALSAMQVAHDAQESVGHVPYAVAFSHFSLGFSLFILALLALVVLLLAASMIIPLMRELVFALSDLLRKKQTQANNE